MPAEKSFSKMILLDTAMKMIHGHKALLDSGKYALQLLCGDTIRAALSICYVYITLNPWSELILTKGTEKYATTAVNDAVVMLKQKVARFGGDQRQLWTAIAASKFMKLKNEPNNREDFMQEAADEFASIFPHIKGGQQVQSKKRAESQSAVNRGLRNEDMLEELGPSEADVHEQLLAHTDLDTWSFEDWDFDNYHMNLDEFLKL